MVGDDEIVSYRFLDLRVLKFGHRSCRARPQGLPIRKLDEVSIRVPHATVIANRKWLLPGLPHQTPCLPGSISNPINVLSASAGETQMAVIVFALVPAWSPGQDHENKISFSPWLCQPDYVATFTVVAFVHFLQPAEVPVEFHGRVQVTNMKSNMG